MAIVQNPTDPNDLDLHLLKPDRKYWIDGFKSRYTADLETDEDDMLWVTCRFELEDRDIIVKHQRLFKKWFFSEDLTFKLAWDVQKGGWTADLVPTFVP